MGRPGFAIAGAAACAVTLIAIALAVVPIAPSIRAPAILLPAGYQSELSAPFGGRIDAVFVAEGQAVREGDHIARLVSAASQDEGDSLSDFDAQLRALEQKKQRIDAQELDVHSRKERALQIQRSLTASLEAGISSELKRLAISRERGEVLENAVREKLVSRSDYLAAASEIIAAEAAVVDRRRNLAAAQSDGETKIAEFDTELTSLSDMRDEVEGQLARIRIEKSAYEVNREVILVAPRNGFIVSLPVPGGAAVESGSSVARISASTDISDVVARVPEEHADVVRVGQPATVELRGSDSVHPSRLRARVVAVGASVVGKAPRDWQAPVTDARSVEVRLQLLSHLSIEEASRSGWVSGRSSTVVISHSRRSLLSYLGRRDTSQ